MTSTLEDLDLAHPEPGVKAARLSSAVDEPKGGILRKPQLLSSAAFVEAFR